MTDFKAGWYRVRWNVRTRQSTCRYFKDASTYVAECLVEPNGEQLVRWIDPHGVQGPGRAATWSDDYARLADAPAGDWWDAAPGGEHFAPAAARAFTRNGRRPNARELVERAACADIDAANGLGCTREIHVGIFFDGTNNNMVRDRKDDSHSNIVVLFDAHEQDNVEKFRYYIPGVGTEFPEIGEFGESSDGKAFAAGGESRIYFAMLQVFNAACRAATTRDLLQATEMKSLAASVTDGLPTLWRLSDGKMEAIFDRINRRLLKAVEGRRPKVTKLHLSVFGFSRGAAQARVFSNWIQKIGRNGIGTAALHVNFLGLFDTVASVALADSSPVGGSGFFDWADGNLDIAGVKRAVHYVAAHEIRRSFPLSTARAGKNYPAGVKEFVYPGAHSDVGGGYDPGCQGKSRQGRSALLSQIPLNDMYFEALNAGVKFRVREKMAPEIRSAFDLAPSLETAFNAYAAWTIVAEKEDIARSGSLCENRMQYHTQLYWRWRAHVSPDHKFAAMESYRHAKPQDRTDLWESELDWRGDVKEALQAVRRTQRAVLPPAAAAGAPESGRKATPLQIHIAAEVNAAANVPGEVSEFFDKFVHDSHAGFWLLGPQTAFDRKAYIKEIRDKKAVYDHYMTLAAKQVRPQVKADIEYAARAYQLNRFEERVLEADQGQPGSMPVLTDADAAHMRARVGVLTSGTLSLMGTATRREPKGHGRYRRVFDQS